MDVSLYVRDAPVRQLPLLGGHVSRHDWYNLLLNWDMLDSAETIADVTYYVGFLLCVLSIGVGMIFAVYRYFKPRLVPKEVEHFEPNDAPVRNALTDVLDRKIQNKGKWME